MEQFLTNLYITNLYPAKAKLLKLAREQRPETKAKEVNDFLDAQLSYQLLKETKNLKSKTGHIVAFRINEIWQIDIYDLSRYEKSNKGYQYMFACLDVFTRYAYIIPMKNKDIDSTTKALKEILLQNKTGPNLIISDNDASFLGDTFQKLLTQNNIHHSPNAVGDHNALGIIDNYAKRIKRILTAQFLETKKKNWIDNIQVIVRMYNRSPHSSLGGFSPMEVMSEQPDINQYIFIINSIKSDSNASISDIVIGDLVRIRLTDGFRKGTDPRFSDKVHSVIEVYGRNIILDNKKKYIRANLLKVPVGSLSVEKPNIIQQAKTNRKVARMLTSNDHTEKTLTARTRRKQLPRQAKK